MTDNRTTELREKLTERDVEWWPMHNNGYYEDRDTEFVVDGKKHTAHEWGDGFAVYNLTPEQAIAATLGGGECEFRPFKDEDWSEPNAVRGVCSECSALMYGKDNYCPNCGKRIRKKVEE